MGKNHCRVYASLPRAELIGVCDRDPDVGRQVARQYGVPFYPSAEFLLENVEAVSVATPTPTHFDLVMNCMRRGVHVLVEKPITETLEQAEIVADAAATHPVIVQVGHIERFNPTFVELKNVLEEMCVLAIQFRRLSPFQGSNTDVDVILDLMVHDIDMVLHLIGQKPVSVDAYGLTVVSGSVDYVTAHLSFDAGPLLTMTASRVTEQKVRCVEVTALEAYVEGDLLNKAISVHRRTVGEYQNLNDQGVKYRQEGIIERIHVPIFEPLILELQHFVDCVVEGKPTQVPAKDGLDVLCLAALIRDAIGDHMADVRSEARTLRQAYVEPELAAA
jgi:predicted dehydrogenase